MGTTLLTTEKGQTIAIGKITKLITDETAA